MQFSEKTKYRKCFIIAANMLIFFFLIRWIWNNVNITLFINSIRLIPLWAGLVTIAINLLCILSYSLRMSIFLGCPFNASFSVISLGFGFNSLFPFRLGEGAKIYYINKIYSIPVAKLIRAFFLEHLYDLAIIFFLGLIALSFKQEFIRNKTIYLVGGIAVVLLVLFGVFNKIFQKIQSNARFFSNPQKHMFIRKIAGIFEGTTGKGDLLFAITFTALVWFLNFFAVYIAFNTYIEGITFTFLNAVVLLVITALSIAIPSAPGGLGIYEAGIVAYLIHSFHISNESALAAAFLFHLMVTMPSIVFMLAILINKKLVIARYNRSVL